MEKIKKRQRQEIIQLIEEQFKREQIYKQKVEKEKKRLGSEERKLYLEFERGEEVEFDDLNKIAKIVLERIIDKLQGTDFNKSMRLDIKQQVERLIRQATSHENLSQSYLGWCPFW